MKIYKPTGVFLLTATLLLLAACQYSPEISERTIAYNQAIADSTNNLFLLNAVRASEREPTYYSRNQANTATGSITPTLSGTFPWGSTPTLATAATVNSNPVAATATGFLNSTTITKTLTKAALTLTPSLTATQSNQLTLTNLDDQQSMNGLLTPVSLQQIANYLNEGFNSQEIFLIYMANLSIPKFVLRDLPDAVAENCAIKVQGETPDERGHFARDLYCEYFFGGKAPATYAARYPDGAIVNLTRGTVFAKFRYEDLTPNSMNPVCFGFPAGTHIIADVSPQVTIDRYASLATPKSSSSDEVSEPATVTLLNDPAFDDTPRAPDAHDMRSFQCFKQVLTALLALDLSPVDGPRKALYRLPMSLVHSNPRYFADLSQQNLEVALITNDGKISALPSQFTQFGVCKKPDDMALGYVADGYVDALFGLGENSISPDRVRGFGGANPTTALFSLDSPQHTIADQFLQQKVGNSIRALAVRMPPVNAAIKLSPLIVNPSPSGDCASAVAAWQTKKLKLNQLTITFTPRSLEAMVYFLGQIIRRRYDVRFAHSEPVTFLNWRNVPLELAPPLQKSANSPQFDYTYQEELFRALKGTPPTDSIAQASDPTGTYFVPSLCDTSVQLPDRDSDECSFEYPNHASAQVLTMLNQIWGLNKTQTAAPIVPTVTVINPP